MATNKITLNELRSLVKKVVNEEIHNESFWEKNLIINVKGLSVLDAIKKIKSQISPMKVLFEKKIEEKNCIILPTYSNRDDLFTQDSITEGYIFYYEKNELKTDVPSNNLTGLKKAEQDYLNDWQGVAITDAKFSTELKLDESKIKATLHELRSIVRQVINESMNNGKGEYTIETLSLLENQTEKFDEIYKAFQQDPVLKKWIYPEGERKRLNINTFMIPGKVFEENFLDIISQKTGLQKDDVRKKLLDNPRVGTKRPTEDSEYYFVDKSPTIYTNGNFLNAYEVLKNALKEL